MLRNTQEKNYLCFYLIKYWHLWKDLLITNLTDKRMISYDTNTTEDN